MAVLNFNALALRRLVDHAKAAPEHDMGWSEDPAKPALVLVGDQGVYLMSNGKPADQREAQKGNYVAYATDHNPNRDTGWWDAKRASFGADDGAETLDIIDSVDLLLKRGETEIRIQIEDDFIGLLMPDISWIKPGAKANVPSGLGGTFSVSVLEVTDLDALVQNAGNSGDFDQAEPYRAQLGKMHPVKIRETA